MHSSHFPDDFIWGASISAAHTESAATEGGKGVSIWDEFCSRPKWFGNPRIRNGHHIDDSADFHTHFRQDIDALKSLGFKNFRFSISWPRLMPDGEHVNFTGIEYYKDVINYCIESGITPWVTIYHWDLPLELEKKGGWTSRHIIDWFTRYAKLCVESFPQVRHWVILNEPSVFVGAGYLFGVHAPGRKGFESFFAAMHHALLTIGRTYRLIKSIDPELQVGSSFSFTQVEAYSNSRKDNEAMQIADMLVNRLFFEPLLGLGYPPWELRKFRELKKFIQEGDMEAMPVDLDFIGVQTYTREVFRYNYFNPFLKVKHVPAHLRVPDPTATNWEVYPECLYNILAKIQVYRPGLKLVITENGVALDDKVSNGIVDDKRRIEYYRSHLAQVIRARREGINIQGYFAWSLIDNFEWAEGYYPRFGLIYVDFNTKKRVLKQSAYWFRQFLHKVAAKEELSFSV